MSTRFKSVAVWLSAFVILLAVSFFTINNAVRLPFHDRAQDVTSFNDQGVAFDAKGHEIKNWQSNNVLDDAIKAVFVAGTLYSLWKLLGSLIRRRWIKIVVTVVITVVIVAAGYFIASILFYKF